MAKSLDALVFKLPKQTFIKEKTFESLKKIFGKDIEIMVGF